MNYKVSIVIPCFNSEKYLENTIGTIINQSFGFENIELILVDDFSTYKTPKIIKKYCEKYENIVTYPLSEKAGAPGSARNVGIEKGKGEFILFMDHDDEYLENTVEILYNSITKQIKKYDNHKQIVIGKFQEFEDSNNISDSWITEDYEISSLDFNENPKFLAIYNIWRMIFPLKFLREEKIKFPEKIFAEDLVFMIESFIKSKNIKFINKIVYKWRIIAIDEDNLSASHSKSINYIGKLIDGYFCVRKVLYENNKMEYYFIFNEQLSYWTNLLIDSVDISDKDKFLLLKKIQPLFMDLKNIEPNFRFNKEKQLKMFGHLKEGYLKKGFDSYKELEKSKKKK